MGLGWGLDIVHPYSSSKRELWCGSRGLSFSRAAAEFSRGFYACEPKI